MVVYKYPLAPVTIISLPWNAQPLSVGLQDDVLVLWVLLDPNEETTNRRFVALNTGTSFELGSVSFIGTVQTTNGIVWHVLEVTR